MLSTGFLKARIGSRRAVFLGQSSGGYASLVAAKYFESSIVIACAPQTFSDASLKNRLDFVEGVRAELTPEGLFDIADHWEGGSSESQFIGIIYSASEQGNPVSRHFWMDHAHMLHIARIDSFDIYIVDCNNHAVIHGRAEKFATLLREICKAPTKNMHALVRRQVRGMFRQEQAIDFT
jgi:hypothetical protein